MRILHFKRTLRAEDGGVVKAVLDLCAMSADSGNEVTIVTCDQSAVPDAWRKGDRVGIRVVKIEGQGRSMDRLSPTQLSDLEREIRLTDVVHLHSMWSGANIQAASTASRSGKPYVLSVHGMLDDWCMSQRRLKKVAFLKTFNRGLIRNAATIHCTAAAELEQASRWIPRDRGVVVPLPLDLADYAQLPETSVAFEAFPQISRSTPIVLFLSRIHYKKGLDRLIRASALLHECGTPHQLVVAGTGEGDYPEEMRRLASSMGIDGHSHFVGFVSGMTKVALLRLADVFALPTSQENFGFVYFEALATGTPVVTTRGTDTWPELAESGAGIIVGNDPESFANAIKQLLSHADRGRSMGLAGRRWVFEHLGTSSVAAAYTSMYDRAVQGVRR